MPLDNFNEYDFNELIEAGTIEILRREKGRNYYFYLIASNGKCFIAERKITDKIYMIQKKPLDKQYKHILLKMSKDEYITNVSAYFITPKSKF